MRSESHAGADNDEQPIDPVCDAIAEAILDGRPIEWHKAAGVRAPLLNQLRVLADVSALHRSFMGGAADAPPDVHSSEVVAGIKWGSLTLLERLGRGGFGEVFRAWDYRLEREVALKLLYEDTEASTHPEASIREGRMLARIRHPNVVSVFGAERLSGRVGIWTEFIHGRTLAELVRERTFTPEEATAIGGDLCRALGAVHEAGLLHRDLKAQNVMRDPIGRIVLMDFGAGREHADDGATTELAGTPLYLAPEAWDGGSATVRSDIYSLGVLLFHLVTGSFPVHGDSWESLREAHKTGRRVSLSIVRPGLPRKFVTAVQRALAADPSDRFASAREMEQALTFGVRRAHVRPALPAILIAVATLLGAWAASLMPSPKPTGIATRELRMPHDADGVSTLSDDGRLLSYTAVDGSLKVMDLATQKTRGVFSAGVGARVDGRTVFRSIADSLVFGVSNDACGCTTLHEAPLRNGPSRQLLAGTRFRSITPLSASRDGVRILVEAAVDAEAVELGILQFDAGTYWRLMPRPLNMQGAALSPDGRYVAYDRSSERPDIDADVYVTSVESGETHAVADGAADESLPVWKPDGRALLYVSDATGGRGLWSNDIASGKPTGPPQLVQRDMGLFVPLSLAAANGTLLYWRTPVLDIETAPFDPARGVITANPQKLPVRQFGANSSPVWSNDGESIVYAAERRVSGPVRSRIVIHNLRDRTEREIRVPVNGPLEPAWSPDSRSLLIRGPGALDAVRGARLVDAVTGNILAVYPYPGLHGVRWSPDGRGFFFGSNAGIHRVDAATRHTRPIRVDGGWSPGQMAISPDGALIAAVAAAGERRAILLIPSAGGAPRILHTPAAGTHTGIVWDWMPDGTRLLVVRRLNEHSSHAELLTMSVLDGTIAPTGLQREGLVQLRISPDGRQIAYRTGVNLRTYWLLERFLPGAL